MAETAAENKVHYEVVADMGSGLVIAKVRYLTSGSRTSTPGL